MTRRRRSAAVAIAALVGATCATDPVETVAPATSRPDDSSFDSDASEIDALENGPANAGTGDGSGDEGAGEDLSVIERVAIPDDVEFFIDYPRYLWHKRRLNVATTNTGNESLHIHSIRLATGHFEPLRAESKTTTI